MFQGPADIGKVAINLYSSLPEREQTFASKCLDYRDVRVGNPKQEKNRLGEIFMRKTPVELLQSSFTAIHIFSTGCFEGHSQCDLGRIWTDDGLLATLNSWEPLQWSKGELEWRGDWRLKKRFDSEGLLLPQVPVEQKWDRLTFLEQTCAKAGMDPNCWKDENTDIFSFTAVVFNKKSRG